MVTEMLQRAIVKEVWNRLTRRIILLDRSTRRQLNTFQSLRELLQQRFWQSWRALVALLLATDMVVDHTRALHRAKLAVEYHESRTRAQRRMLLNEVIPLLNMKTQHQSEQGPLRVKAVLALQHICASRHFRHRAWTMW